MPDFDVAPGSFEFTRWHGRGTWDVGMITFCEWGLGWERETSVIGKFTLLFSPKCELRIWRQVLNVTVLTLLLTERLDGR